MTHVYFHRLAVDEYRRAFHWYRQKAQPVADQFRDAVDHAVRRIAENPALLPVIRKDYRRVRVNRYPYILVFRQRGPDNFQIVAVAHTSRRAAYWRRRN